MERWSLVPAPEVRLGAGDGDSSLYRVMDAIRLDDGRIAVVNAGSRSVRVFGPGGEWLADWGREGRGP